MPLSAREIRPLVWLIQAWNKEGQYVHVLANLNNKAEVNTAIVKVCNFKDTYEFPGLWVEPSSLSHKLPGIHKKQKHPMTGKEMELFSIIIDLNDNKGWSRGQIADWIETLDEVPVF